MTQCQDHSMGKGEYFKQMVLVKLDIHMQTNEIGHLPYNIYQN